MIASTGSTSFTEFLNLWESLHGNVKAEGVVLGWLRISYLIARALRVLRVTPNLLTLLGVVASVLVFSWSRSYLALIFLLLAVVADGVDGSLAIYSGRDSRQGALLDSVADRVSELFWVLALYTMGAPLGLALALLVIANTQEYARARLLSLGKFETGVVTWGERPHRAIYLALAITFWHIKNGLLAPIVVSMVLMQVIALVMVLRDAYTQIRVKDRLSN